MKVQHDANVVKIAGEQRQVTSAFTYGIQDAGGKIAASTPLASDSAWMISIFIHGLSSGHLCPEEAFRQAFGRTKRVVGEELFSVVRIDISWNEKFRAFEILPDVTWKEPGKANQFYGRCWANAERKELILGRLVDKILADGHTSLIEVFEAGDHVATHRRGRVTPPKKAAAKKAAKKGAKS